ncbi:MAG: class I SAM-dependent methyltransferase [Candidatus Eiseniibacteriota bacterium]
MTAEKTYVLGTHDEEIARLGLQHSVWLPRASAAWRRAGFRSGQTLVDLGCGPGYATCDLAAITGPTGRVIGIDRSRRFLDHLDARARAMALAHVETVELDLDEQDLPAVEADGLWSRWVYAFVRKPRPLLERAARMIRPGGAMVLHEYVDYRAWRLSPARAEFEEFVAAVIASWRANGGEPDVGLDLPRWLGELGFEVKSLKLLADAARKHDRVWEWPEAFVESGLRRLVELGHVREDRAPAILEAYRSFAATPHAFQLTPTVIEIIARRR